MLTSWYVATSHDPFQYVRPGRSWGKQPAEKQSWAPPGELNRTLRFSAPIVSTASTVSTVLLCLQPCCVYNPPYYVYSPTVPTALLCLQPYCIYRPTVYTASTVSTVLLYLQPCCVYNPTYYVYSPTMSTVSPYCVYSLYCVYSPAASTYSPTVTTALLEARGGRVQVAPRFHWVHQPHSLMIKSYD